MALTIWGFRYITFTVHVSHSAKYWLLKHGKKQILSILPVQPIARVSLWPISSPPGISSATDAGNGGNPCIHIMKPVASSYFVRETCQLRKLIRHVLQSLSARFVIRVLTCQFIISWRTGFVMTIHADLSIIQICQSLILICHAFEMICLVVCKISRIAVNIVNRQIILHD
jgi:hypothetical protein